MTSVHPVEQHRVAITEEAITLRHGMLLRGTPALAIALCVHLGSVLALFLMLPYGKFAHAVYRVAALLKWSIERRQPSRLALPDD